MTHIDPVAAAGFGSAARAYERARPSYPGEAIEWLVERLRLGPGTTVVDLAAGTGKLTRLLVPTGARVVAVEPIGAMREQLVGVVPAAEVVDGVAERIPLGDAVADAVTVAQAFHWFRPDEALAEIHRVLRDGGSLALLWNTRDLEDPLQAAVERVLRPYRQAVPAHEGREWRAALAASGLFAAVEERRFAFVQELDTEGLCERTASTSFIAALPDPERERVLARVRELAARLEQPFPYPYVTEVFVCSRR